MPATEKKAPAKKATKKKDIPKCQPDDKVEPQGKFGANETLQSSEKCNEVLQKEKKPSGRPPVPFDAEFAARLCAEIATSSESIRTLHKRLSAEMEKVPSIETIFKWLGENEIFAEQYARAKESQADMMTEDMLDIADDDSLDIGFTEDGKPFVKGENIQRSRLRVDTRKWLASKLKPKKYGEKIEQTIHTDPITLLVGQIGASSLPLKP